MTSWPARTAIAIGSDEASGSSTNSTRRGAAGGLSTGRPVCEGSPAGSRRAPGSAGRPHLWTPRRPIPARVDETYAGRSRGVPALWWGDSGHSRRDPVPRRPAGRPAHRAAVPRPDRVLCRLPAPRAGSAPAANLRALGAAGVQLGPGAVTFTVLLHKHVGVPLDKIATLLHDRFGLTVSREDSPRSCIARRGWRGPRMRPSALRSGGVPSSVPMKPAGASVPCCTGCGRSRHPRPPCMRFAPGVALTTRPPSWARTSPACWSAMAGRPIAASPARCIRAVWRICSVGVAAPRRPSAEPLGGARADRPHRRPRAPRSARRSRRSPSMASL